MKKIFLLLTIVFIATFSFAQQKNSKTDTIKIMGSCGMCKTRIESTLKKMKVYKSNWNDETLMLIVSYDSIKINKADIQQKLADVGHESEGYYTKDEVYNNLPECCHYERLKNPNNSNEINSDSTKQQENNTSQHIKGVVLEETNKGKFLALGNATIRLTESKKEYITNSDGGFMFNVVLPEKMIVHYTGFKSDTITLSSEKNIVVFLKRTNNNTLEEVKVTASSRSAYVASYSTLNTLQIGIKELAKAACCNLSESFETSPSVDVSYADAVTGMKQIQLLGLSGNYTQLLTETVPEIKGLAGSYGLTFVPGTWLESIQVTKGTGSVVNGYESIAGQINIEEKKPDKMEKFFANAYANGFGRLEASLNYAQNVNEKLSTALLAHINGVVQKNDQNKDGFLDMPIGKQFNIINRWKYANTNGIIAQFALKALQDDRQAGDINFNSKTDKLTTNKYGVGLNVKQVVATAKLGYNFPNHKYKSIGLLVSANNLTNNSYYGLRSYDATHRSFYSNLIYQSIIHSTEHKFRTGLSFSADDYNETISPTSLHKRNENVFGAFFEYTYTAEKFSAILGLREDYHNYFGLITTPRLHLKYDFNKQTNFRLTAGKGFRVANIFAENRNLFVSSRVFKIMNASGNYAYGLEPEKAWNFGINFIHNFKINNHAASFGVDLYRTDFINQVVVDVDANPQQVHFYNLHGKSFSNSFLAELNFEPLHSLEVRMAYRMLDVQTNYHGMMMEKTLIAKHRAFLNIAYETDNDFKFDITAQWIGKKRLPNTNINPIGKRMEDYSPAYWQLNAQITKQFGKKWDVYIGAENITNFMQHHFFIDAKNPFGNYFDGSIIWGNINGRTIYLGMRFKLKE